MDNGTAAADAAFHDQLKADAEFWAKTYPTRNDPAKIQDFINDVMTYRNASGAIPIKKAIDTARTAFAGESGTNADKLSRILLHVALHERGGGNMTAWAGGGQARGWWQVEPASARSTVSGSGTMWGHRARLATGYTLATLKTLPDKEFSQLRWCPRSAA